MEIVKEISLDVARENNIIIRAKQFDKNSRFLKIQLCNEGTPLSITPEKVGSLSVRRADGAFKFVEGEVLEDGKVKVEIDSWVLSAAGTSRASMSISATAEDEVNKGSKLSTLNFIIIVEPANYDNIVPSPDPDDTQIDIQDLYYHSHENFANAVKANLTGDSEAIRVNDVSPVNHMVKCRVRGKNFIDITKALAAMDGQAVEVNVDENCVVFSGSHCFKIPVVIESGVAVVFSCESDHYDSYVFEYEDGSLSPYISTAAGITEKTTKYICIYKTNQATAENNMMFKNLQLELGSVVTTYEHYINPLSVTVTRYGETEADNIMTYTPDINGLLEVPSISPVMTLVADTKGVNIELEYNKDINKVLANLPTGGGGGSSNIEVDNTVTQHSDNPVSSDAVYNEFVIFSNAYDQKIIQDIDSAIQQANNYTDEKIPTVTTADAGKFLRVSNEGKWVVETIPNAEEVAF